MLVSIRLYHWQRWLAAAATGVALTIYLAKNFFSVSWPPAQWSDLVPLVLGVWLINVLINEKTSEEAVDVPTRFISWFIGTLIIVVISALLLTVWHENTDNWPQTLFALTAISLAFASLFQAGNNVSTWFFLPVFALLSALIALISAIFTLMWFMLTLVPNISWFLFLLLLTITLAASLDHWEKNKAESAT